MYTFIYIYIYTILYIDCNLKKVSNIVMPQNFSLDLFKMIRVFSESNHLPYATLTAWHVLTAVT